MKEGEKEVGRINPSGGMTSPSNLPVRFNDN